MPDLTREEIHAWAPYAQTNDDATAVARTRRRLKAAGQWGPWQMMGRRFAIGCVALEITQRCNLDCTYCYLSEASEALKDVPLAEILRRIDLIHAHYGDVTDVQVTGGDPTLRKRDELIEIVRYITAKNMRASLFTNGIKADRALLEALCNVGLKDIAFHVDMTQKRRGYGSETELHALRREYLERARGLPIAVFFNTTVYPDNFHEVPDIVRFFGAHSDVVRLAAFQIGADTGRGTDRRRPAVDPETLKAQIEAGTGAHLNFDAAGAGHRQCNRYAAALVINGAFYDLFAEPALAQYFLDVTRKQTFDRARRARLISQLIRCLLAKPGLLARLIPGAARLAWRARRDLIAARGRIGKLSFHIHNFMDSGQLDEQRAHACSFMVMTQDGPMSMCMHNAKRDYYLLKPTPIGGDQKLMFWDPTTGRRHAHMPQRLKVELSRKNARGRAKIQDPRL